MLVAARFARNVEWDFFCDFQTPCFGDNAVLSREDAVFFPIFYSLCFCRQLLKEVKKAGEIHIVLDCSTEKIQSVLKQAAQVGMMTAYHNYLITSLVNIKKPNNYQKCQNIFFLENPHTNNDFLNFFIFWHLSDNFCSSKNWPIW